MRAKSAKKLKTTIKCNREKKKKTISLLMAGDSKWIELK
jgi:hypothetical protein